MDLDRSKIWNILHNVNLEQDRKDVSVINYVGTDSDNDSVENRQKIWKKEREEKLNTDRR